jgi:hypothetical protein
MIALTSIKLQHNLILPQCQSPSELSVAAVRPLTRDGGGGGGGGGCINLTIKEK